jgi:2-hydroxy-3-oxopropionate reductase
LDEVLAMLTRIGFVGLGIMGKPMVRNLLKAGYPVKVYDCRAEPIEELVANGAAAAQSGKEVARDSDVIITMLPDGPDVEGAVMGTDGILAACRPGAILIDMSSISPSVAQKIGAACQLRGVEFLDAPVSGGEPKAREGTLAIMVGGDVDIFETVTPILRSMGSTVTLTGPAGAGNMTKLANQIIVACNIAAISEAFVLAARAGLDPDIVVHAIKGGLAGSAVLNAKAPMMIARNFEPGFKLRLHQKDLRNALASGKELGVSLPLTEIVQGMINSLVEAGKGDYDHSAIVTALERIAGIELTAAI